MTNKVFLNDQQIVEVQIEGDQVYDTVIAGGQEVMKVLQVVAAKHKPGLILVDLRQMASADTTARQALNKLAHELPYTKAALVAQDNPLRRQRTKLVLEVIGLSRKIRSFTDRDRAIRWLLS